jgi:geranylgeranyl diphosphate synthase type II
MDMNFEHLETVSEAEYIDMIRLKTSVLLGFAMEVGGIVAGADASSAQHLYEAGVNIGIGFQLKDDLLDVYGDPAKFGKQVGGDIIANKKTFLLIEALERAEGQTRLDLLDWVNRGVFDKSDKVDAVTAIYDQLGICELTEARIADYFAKGFTNLEQVTADPARKDVLLTFAHQLVERES